ncbi:hypothetical protein [Rhizobium sp.]
MGWREETISRHEADIKSYKATIEAIDNGTFDIGDVDSHGNKTSTAQDLKATYNRIIDELEKVLISLRQG